jgi:hypothetical protein
VRVTRRRNATAALIVPLVLVASVHTVDAHRRDEYLQAARLSIEPADIEMTLDLTPGIALAENILSDIDEDTDGVVSADEVRFYATRVLRAVSLEIDGTPLLVRLVDSAFPARDAVLSGEGTIRVRARASMPRLPAGPHHLHYRNTHRSDVAVYLANALMPVSPRVSITGQRRDVDQRELTVDYVLQNESGTAARGLVAGTAAGLIWLAASLWRRGRRRRHATTL